MITHCPHCSEELSFTDAQQVKIEAALDSLKSGTLKLKCPQCKEPIELLSDGTLADWRQEAASTMETRSIVEPPEPPDINWLTEGSFDEEQKIRDIPKALILIDPGEIRDMVTGAMVESFFQPTVVDTIDEAMEKIRAIQYDTVIMYTGFDGVSLKKSEFHVYMIRLQMVKRRYIYYVLIGPNLHTLYGLEALSNSANLVVNDNDVSHFKTIYKRGKSDYEDLFGPYIEALQEQGSV